MLLKLLPRFRKHSIVRTRDEEVLKAADVCVDVGLVYDPLLLRFDHHQMNFLQTFESQRTPLSSAGLIYRHFGKDILSVMLPDSHPEDLLFLYRRVYYTIIEAIDAMDNGLPPCTGDAAYRDFSGLAADIPRMNVTAKSLRLEEEVFEEAMDYSRSTLEAVVQYLRDVELPASKLVQAAFENRRQYNITGLVLVLQKDVPWKEAVKQINRNRIQVLYCVHPQGEHWKVTRTAPPERQLEHSVVYEGLRSGTGVLNLRRDLASALASTEKAALSLVSALLARKSRSK